MSNQFEDAKKQFLKVAGIINLKQDMVDRLINPQRFVEVNFPVKMDDGSTKTFKGYRSQHNNARGPYKGGIRFSLNVSEQEVKALSMWMSWKCAVAGIPFGGGKGGVVVNTKKLSLGELERLSRGYIRAIYEIIGENKDVPAPDMYTTPQIMTWMVDEYSKLVGKDSPAVITGKAVDKGGSRGRTEATGQGGVFVLQEIAKKENLDAEHTNIAIQGSGNVGYHFAKLAQEAGFKIVALSDSKGGIFNPQGLNVETVMKYKKDTGSFAGYPEGRKISNQELLELEVDVLVPAAIEDVITKDNAKNIKAKYIIEMANGPITPKADTILGERSILVVPDVLANSGGVTVSYFEWAQNKAGEVWEKEKVITRLKDTITKAFNDTWEAMEKHQTDMRMGAYILAVSKVVEKMEK